MRWLAVLLALLLGGCGWDGPPFFPPNAGGPLSPGRYRLVEPGVVVKDMRIVRAADGWLTLVSPGDGHPPILTLAPLATPGRRLWVTELTWPIPPGLPAPPPGAATAIYGLTEQRDDGVDVQGGLPCEGDEALVTRAGGHVVRESESGDPHCDFPTAAALTRALTAYAAAHPHLTGSRLVRVGD